MIPYLQDADVTLYQGDASVVLPTLAAESVDCCITSPPYWGLRDYGQEGQYGLEPTPEQYVERMVEVFREVRRVLAAHGTVWLNLGDSYAGSGPSGASYQSETTKRREGQTSEGSFRISETLGERGLTYAEKKPIPPPGLKPKDLVGIPWRVAFALQADGWYLRSDIIWAKPNPMPESVRDRPTKSHEYVFLLSKQKRYFFDQEAVREPAEWARWGDQTVPKYEGTNTKTGWMQPKTAAELRNKASVHRSGIPGGRSLEAEPSGGRNIRSVWEIATQPYAEAHFATFPEELPRRAILAGCPEKVCRTCGKPQERIVETDNPSLQVADEKTLGWANTHQKTSNPQSSKSLHRNPGGVYSSAVVKGWSDCGHDDYRSGVVLDPFAGSGTTAFVARKQLRHSVLIELNEDYCKLICKRLAQQSLFA